MLERAAKMTLQSYGLMTIEFNLYDYRIVKSLKNSPALAT
jgi:hypothetical protein